MNNVKTSLREGLSSLPVSIDTRATSRGKEGQPARTPTAGGDSLSVVLLTKTPAFGIAFGKHPTFVGQNENTSLQVFFLFAASQP